MNALKTLVGLIKNALILLAAIFAKREVKHSRTPTTRGSPSVTNLFMNLFLVHHEPNCNSGLRWDKTKNRCVDINECEENLHTCTETETCINTFKSFKCNPVLECKKGFAPDSFGRGCVGKCYKAVTRWHS